MHLDERLDWRFSQFFDSSGNRSMSPGTRGSVFDGSSRLPFSEDFFRNNFERPPPVLGWSGFCSRDLHRPWSMLVGGNRSIREKTVKFRNLCHRNRRHFGNATLINAEFILTDILYPGQWDHPVRVSVSGQFYHEGRAVLPDHLYGFARSHLL